MPNGRPETLAWAEKRLKTGMEAVVSPGFSRARGKLVNGSFPRKWLSPSPPTLRYLGVRPRHFPVRSITINRWLFPLCPLLFSKNSSVGRSPQVAAAPHIWAGDSTFAAISGFHGHPTKTCERVTNPCRSPRPEYLATSSARIMRIIIISVLCASLLVVACWHDQAGGPQQSSLSCASPPKPQR